MPNDKFPKTSWSLIVRAGANGREALKALCEAYWYPVYAFIRRHTGSADDARDLTQGFFAYLLEKNAVASVDPTRGTKFRSWLLGCVKNYVGAARKKERALKRNEGQPLESLDAAAAEDRYQAEASHHLTPESLFARHFALSVLDRVLERLRARLAAAGKEALFEALKGCLTQAAAPQPYAQIALQLKMSEEAVKKAAFDLRARWKEEIQDEVASLVDARANPEGPATKAQVTEELRELLAALEE